MMPPHAPVTRTQMSVTSNNVHHGLVDRADSGIGGGSGSGSSPTTSLDMVTRDVGGLNIQVRNIIVSVAGYWASCTSNYVDIFQSRLYFYECCCWHGCYLFYVLVSNTAKPVERLHVCLDITIFISFVCTKVDCVGSRSWANKSSFWSTQMWHHLTFSHYRSLSSHPQLLVTMIMLNISCKSWWIIKC